MFIILLFRIIIVGGNMKNDKEIRKAFDGLTEDVLDNYNDYKMEHKIMVKDQLNSFKRLNDILSIYDNKKQKEEIRKEFNELKDDILDQYDNYSDEHKQMVATELEKYKTLNEILDEYDKPQQVQKKKNWLDLLFQAFGIKR